MAIRSPSCSARIAIKTSWQHQSPKSHAGNALPPESQLMASARNTILPWLNLSWDITVILTGKHQSFGCKWLSAWSWDNWSKSITPFVTGRVSHCLTSGEQDRAMCWRNFWRSAGDRFLSMVITVDACATHQYNHMTYKHVNELYKWSTARCDLLVCVRGRVEDISDPQYLVWPPIYCIYCL